VTEQTADERELRTKLDKAEHDKEALQGLLRRAASELEHVVSTDCSDAAKDEALDAATKLRRAAAG
jgi:hypothetical protein